MEYDIIQIHDIIHDIVYDIIGMNSYIYLHMKSDMNSYLKYDINSCQYSVGAGNLHERAKNPAQNPMDFDQPEPEELNDPADDFDYDAAFQKDADKRSWSIGA